MNEPSCDIHNLQSSNFLKALRSGVVNSLCSASLNEGCDSKTFHARIMIKKMHFEAETYHKYNNSFSSDEGRRKKLNLAVLELYFLCCGITTHFESQKLIFQWID